MNNQTIAKQMLDHSSVETTHEYIQKIEKAIENLTVLLPPNLKAAVKSEAKDKGVSMGAVIRWALLNRYRQQAQAAELEV